MKKKVVVLGANFGGLTAALALKHEMHGDVDVTVVSDRDYFLFNPSLIWVPFGKRVSKDITFNVAPTFDKGGVDFEQSAAKHLDPAAKTVTLDNGKVLTYDYLVIATGTRNRAAYTASKGAILSLTRNMALDYAADRVRVNCLCPGFVNTPLLATMPSERRARLAALHPLGRMGEPEDLVPMALLLISDQASWITGQAIAVDGGFSAAGLRVKNLAARDGSY